MTPEAWIIVALAAYWLYFIAMFEALKPKPGEWRAASPDWFWVHGTYEEFKPEPSGLEQSKPTSGAG